MSPRVKPIRPLEYVIVDQTLVELYLVILNSNDEVMDIVQAWLVFALDLYSRMLLGAYMSLEPPSVHSLMRVIRDVIKPKQRWLKRFGFYKGATDGGGRPHIRRSFMRIISCIRKELEIRGRRLGVKSPFEIGQSTARMIFEVLSHKSWNVGRFCRLIAFVIGESQMQPANFRAVFRETLQELTNLSGDAPTNDRVTWTADLTRGQTWYHFNGYCRDGLQFSSGRAFRTSDGSVANDEGILMTFRLLDFQYNEFIGAYAGDRRLSTQIASEFLEGFVRVPEIVAITIDRDSGSSDDGRTRAVTRLVFVGFEQLEDVDDVGSGKQLASSRLFLSPYWCRDRISVEEVWRPKPLNAGGAI